MSESENLEEQSLQDLATYDATSGLSLLSVPSANDELGKKEHPVETNLPSQLEYWRQQLANIPSILELPSDRPRPRQISLNIASQSFEISGELTRQLKILSRQLGVTLFITLLSAFGVLMHRYSQQEDIAIGSPVANRNQKETEILWDFGVNLVAFRLNLEDNPSFTQLVAQVQQTVLAAYAHQDLSFETLVEKLQPERSLNYHPLFQVMFTLYNSIAIDDELSGLNLEKIALESVTAKLDLTLSMTETEMGLKGTIKYKTDLFDTATINRILGHWQTLLAAIALNSEQKIGELPLLTPAERQQILVDWNQTQVEYPQDRCLHQLVEAQAKKTPEAIAVIFREQKLTYRELNARADQLARYLQKFGVKPEVKVGICVERSLELVIAILGVLKAGGAYVPLDPNYPRDRLAEMLSDSQALVLLTEENLGLALLENRTKVIYLDNQREIIAQEQEGYLRTGVIPSNLAYVIYTSGSTGKPKGVQIEHKNVVNLLTSMIREPGITKEDLLLSVTTICFDISVLEIFLPLIVGARLILVSREVAADGIKLKQAIEHYGATMMQATPVTWQLLLAAGGTTQNRLKMLSGGEPLPRKLADRLLKQAASLWNVYGPTETTIWSSIERVEEGDNPISIGKPIANTQFYILDARLQPVPVGVPGDLYIGGDGVSRGYLNRPELTQEKFISHPFSPESEARIYKTGDLARYLPDGRIVCLGRGDYQVKIRGFRIELGEIEANLAQHPSVERTTVIVREEGLGEPKIVAYLVAASHSTPTAWELRQFLQNKLPQYMLPSAFVVLESLPLTANGKINRSGLPTPQDKDFSRDREYIPPRTSTEVILTKIFNNIFQLEQIGIHDNFFELGGHSLLALKLFSEIEKQLGKTLPLATLFQAPTIEQLASLLQQESLEIAYPSLVPIQPKGSRSPLFLVHALGTSVIFYQELANYLDSQQPVYALQPRGLNGDQPLKKVEDMARHYIQEIQKVQPQGPYCLGGYSFGGKVAFEMAQQLQKQGQQIDKLILIDCFGSNYCQRLPFAKRILLHVRNLVEGKHHYGITKLISWIRYMGQEFQYVIQRIKIRLLQAWGLPLSLTLQNRLIEDRNERASQQYQPKLYRGKITLLRAMDWLGGIGYDIDRYLGWGCVAEEGVEVYEVLGNHLSLFETENLPDLAKKLNTCLAESS
jgi:amino acid adenylation domain-containing protein